MIIESFKIGIRNLISPLRILYYIFRTKDVEIEIAKGDFWFGTDANFELNRYRSLLYHLTEYPKAFFHNLHTINIENRIEGDKNLNFSVFFKLNDLFFIYRRAFLLKRRVKRVHGPYLITQFFKSISFTQLSIMMLRDILVNRAMTKYPPRAVFLTTANTYPPARLMTRRANLHGIPSFVVACRPMFTDLRPEERTCVSDLTMVHDAKIADYFVVWDLFSKTTLIGQKIPEDRIFVQQNHSSTLVKHFTLESALLILFSDTELNEKLIAQLKQLKGNINLSLAIKTHPAVKLNQNQIERLTELFPSFVDVSAYKMHEINFKDVVAMCVNTSAGVEACSYGCGIIWLPYLNERAIIFYSVMKVLGWNFSNQDDLSKALHNLSNDALVRQDFINGCQKSYQEHFVTADDIEILLPLLKSISV